MHWSLDSATSATGPAACLQGACGAFGFNTRRLGVRRHDLWSGLDKLVASVRLAGDWFGVLLWVWTQTQQGSSATCGSGSAQRRAINGRLSNFPGRRGLPRLRRSQELYADSFGDALNRAVRRNLGILDVLLSRPMGQTHGSHRRAHSSLDVSRPEAFGSNYKAG